MEKSRREEKLVPPHDLDAEGVMLSAILLEPGALDQVLGIVTPEQCYSEANRRILETAVELAKRGQPVDVVTVAGALRDGSRLAAVGGAVYLGQLVDSVPSVAHVEAYAHRVHEKYRLRQLIATCQGIVAEGYGEVGDIAEFVDHAEQSVFRIARRGDRREPARIGEVMDESYAHMLANEARVEGEVELPTGLLGLDRKIGGLGRGCVTVIAARPGMGKTALACGAAENIAARGEPVVFFSVEMPRKQLGLRMACARAGANVQRAVKGRLYPNERASVLLAGQELRQLPIWIDDTPAISLMEIRSKARARAAEAGRRLGLIVVDYLQLMSGRRDDRHITRDRELSEITSGFKALAKELDCAVVLLSQLNRECEQERDKRPHLRHLRESGGIEQDADDVIFVYRDDYYDPSGEERGLAELIVAKQRNGPTGTVKAAFFGRSTSFEDLTHETNMTTDEED